VRPASLPDYALRSLPSCTKFETAGTPRMKMPPNVALQWRMTAGKAHRRMHLKQWYHYAESLTI
jgi:hypothetical protein